MAFTLLLNTFCILGTSWEFLLWFILFVVPFSLRLTLLYTCSIFYLQLMKGFLSLDLTKKRSC